MYAFSKLNGEIVIAIASVVAVAWLSADLSSGMGRHCVNGGQFTLVACRKKCGPEARIIIPCPCDVINLSLTD
jgi:hypothetical protein